jgi:carbamoyltransferase
MNFLGINAGHGASVALMINGKIEIVLQEERFTKIKNYFGFPKLALGICIDYIKKSKIQIDIAAFSTLKPNVASYKYPIGNYFEVKEYKDFYGDQYYSKILKKKSVKIYLEKLKKNAKNVNNISLPIKKLNSLANNDFEGLRNLLTLELRNLAKKLIKKIIFIDHHTCHAHYAYFSLDRNDIKNKKIATLVIDSQGDGINQSLWMPSQDGNNITIVNKTSECDVARIYKLVTLILSMKPNEHEYKVMGMAPFAKKKYCEIIYEKVFKNILQVKNCSIIHNTRPKDLYLNLKKNLEEYRFDNIAGAVQIFIERIISELLRQINHKYKIQNFTISGGVSMNIKMNKVLSELSFVKNLYVSPTGTDESLSIGACYYLSKHNSYSLENIYLGRTLFQNNNLKKKKLNKIFKDKKKFSIKKNVKQKFIAKLLYEGEVIALAQGREEFGARALGNRSIIANPSKINAVKTINEMIKNRDFWMPFALSILYEKHSKFINNKKKILSEFMTIGFDTIKKNNHLIQAGIHPYDQTVRPQMLKKNKNLNYYNLINEFYKISGVPAVLNTSLNLHGFPISSGIDDVVKTFKLSGLKYLFLENKYLIIKKNYKFVKKI